MLPAAMGLAFLAAVLMILGGASVWEGIRRSPLRLVRERLSPSGKRGPILRVFRDETMSSVPVLHRWLSRVPLASTLRQRLDQAEISQPVGMVLGVILLLAILGGQLAWLLTSSWFWSILATGAIGGVPALYVLRRRRARLSRYAEQLPDALDVLTRALQAGQSFMQGLQAVAREMPEPAATEFRMTFEALRLGHSLREAFQAHAARVDNLDFNLFATAVLIQREVGGNLTEILENASRTIRERYRLLGQIRALSAEHRLTGRIIGALPLAIGVMIYLLRPDLIMVLFKEELGRTLMAAAVVMQVLGFFVMKRIMTIKI
ncbi:MAG: type II secretion system F family protein [Candidatus Rokubacteria bacterium]|nr:type II secretion system F family protein [Candidatus Rokubacteria bacterium]